MPDAELTIKTGKPDKGQAFYKFKNHHKKCTQKKTQKEEESGQVESGKQFKDFLARFMALTALARGPVYILNIHCYCSPAIVVVVYAAKIPLE